jgi:hypothetical protein
MIENTFTDMPTVARKYRHPKKYLLICSLGIPGLYYLAPILCSEKWRSINLIPKLTRLPLLFLAGDRDEVIPSYHMKQLWLSAANASNKGFSSPTRQNLC